MSSPGIEIADGAFQVEASVIATGLDVEPAQILILMRSGEITSICEQGVGADAGFHRLMFRYRNRRFRFAVAATSIRDRRDKGSVSQIA